MKPLLAVKVERRDVAEPVKEWEPAEHHLTHDGQNAFMARMKARIAAAEKARKSNAEETTAKVKQINRRKA